MMRIVSAPADLVVATNDGVDVRFAGIEAMADVPIVSDEWLGREGVRIYFQGIRSHETWQRDVRYEEQLAQWAELRNRDGEEAAGDPPSMPGQLVLGPVGAVISDDAGTTYRLSAGQVAGSAAGWEASWVYLPEPPKTARLLTLEFTLDSQLTGKTCQVRLD
ncbi:hypothetical protein CQ019_05610 [Arthrobacter sp. MYb229]|uniref:hypothetical protein n=1 Tax=Micrococcaceae TaxID=1268 RepID=UPI000CFC758A|nr:MULTISPECIES: hypothetical protein [unclassified Arthrobacter]PRA06833.1 hypothetical protein CQ019_05610 [Arthrobacter sp. MYb229]PRB53735.1 hypothetical protein CQ013_05610 [Arthrobacter sp. MYb216]